MDKEYVISILTSYYISNKINYNEINYLLTTYCNEFKKDSNKTKVLINILQQSGWINYYFEIALKYYMNKYNIYTLYKKPNSIFCSQNSKEYIKFY